VQELIDGVTDRVRSMLVVCLSQHGFLNDLRNHLVDEPNSLGEQPQNGHRAGAIDATNKSYRSLKKDTPVRQDPHGSSSQQGTCLARTIEIL
jgi:hypothetical protein